MSAVIVRISELPALAEGLASDDLLALVNISDTTNEPTGETVGLTPAQLVTFLQSSFRGLSGTIAPGDGYQNAPKTVNLDGTAYTPEPTTGQFITFSGATATSINAMSETGMVTHMLAAGQDAAIVLNPAYTAIGPSAGARLLQTLHDGANLLAIWSGGT